QIMAAAMAVAVAGDRPRLGNAGLLAQARQRIVFAEDGDDRAALARFAHDGGRDAGEGLGDAEALLLQHGGMLGDGAELAVAQLRHAPDPIAQLDEGLRLGIDALPDFFAVLHIGYASAWVGAG